MFCRMCGKQLPDYAAFCSGCGTPCKRPNPAPVMAPQPQAPVVPETEVELPVIQQEEVAIQVEQPLEEVVEAPAEQIQEEIAEAPAEQIQEEVTEEPAEQIQEEVVEEPAEQIQEEVVEEPAQQIQEEIVEEPAQQIQEKIVEAPVAPMQEAVQAPVVRPAPVVAPQKVNKPRKQRKRPHVAVRVLMQLLSYILFLALFASLLATVVVADLQKITSADGIKRILDTFLGVSKSSAEYVAPPAAPQGQTGYGAVALADFEIDFDDIPDDILVGGNGEDNVNALVEWLYEELKEDPSNGIKFTKQEFQSFVENSTVTDYISEKLAGYAEDFINGTEETDITTEEIMDLLEENKREMRSELNVQLTTENKQKIEKQVDKVVVEQDINTTIREKVNTSVEKALQEGLGLDMETVRPILQVITSDMTLVLCIFLCVLLVGLLCLVNFYNVRAGLTWSASAGLLAGAVVAGPLLVLRYASDWITGLVPGLENVIGLVNSFTAVLAPIHYGLLIGAAVLLVLTIVWRIVAKYLRNRNRAESVARAV